MVGKRGKSEDVALKLRQVEVPQGQGKSIQYAVRQIGVTVQTYYRWRKEYGSMNRDQLKRLNELVTENQRLRRAVSDLTLEKMILTEAARGTAGPSERNFCALPAAVSALSMSGRPLAYLSAGSAAHSGNMVLRKAGCPAACQVKSN
jgi:putative transposase